MLSSIHPLGERAKHNSFAVTAAAYLLGSVLGGATAGLVAGAVGVGLDAVSDLPGSTAATAIVAGAAIAAAGFEATGRALPSLRRQVDERWLDTYRNWVYGFGYGVQLGAGVTTYVTTAAVYVVVVAAALVGDLPLAVVIGATFGLVRGLSILPARSVRSTERLVALFQRLERRAPAVRRASSATLGLVGVVALGVVLA